MQLQQAITALALNVLPQSAIESYVSELLIEVDTATIAGRSTRALASTLVAFTDRYPHRWDAVVDTAWEQMPAANKGAVAECLSRGSVPDARTRAKRIVGGGSCPREVAELLLKAFPD